jgi:aldose 1-epimerase
MVNKKTYGKLNGDDVYSYSLINKNGTQIKIINYGAIVTNIFFRNRNGKIEDIVLGYDNLSGYIKDDKYMGAIVGRYGNRIAKGIFKIGDKEYRLNINNGNNHLHGGLKGFNKVLWNSEVNGDDSVILSYVSSDGEEGYPGEVKISVIFTLSANDELKIRYEGTTNKTTILNPTHHSYFNLSGDFKKTVLGHELRIEAGEFIPVNKEQIPTGLIADVKGTPMDFSSSRPVGGEIDRDYEQLLFAGGYDHTWVLKNFNGHIRQAAVLSEPASGRTLEVYTDQPGIQFYTGNFLDGCAEGKDGITYQPRTGLCLETQKFPDSPNQPAFPSPVLKPGEVYQHNTIYKFSTD